MPALNPVLFDVALTAYMAATATAVASLLSRREPWTRATAVLTRAGWLCHTVAIAVRGVELGRVPLGTVPEVVSALIWAAVLLELWAARRFQVEALGAFVLPVVLVLGLTLPTELRTLVLDGRTRSAWIWAHVVLALVGLAALCLNFAAALMYLLQERQLKGKHPGSLYYGLPSLETLDRLGARALILGFPFLTAALVLGAMWARTAWGGATFDPLAVFSPLAWMVYAATLAARLSGRWRGRRAAYFAVAGFCVLLLTLGAGLLLQGRHAS